MYSYLANFYKNNIDIYTSIVENSIYCFSKVIIESESESERQSAAIRLFLLSYDNEKVVKGILYKLVREKYGDNTFEIILLQLVDSDLCAIRSYCLLLIEEGSKKVFISDEYMRKYHRLSKSLRKSSSTPEALEKSFILFYEEIHKIIKTPYERRITALF